VNPTNSMNVNIIYTDPHIVIVNKPGGLLSVPGRGPDKQDCVVNRIKKLFPDCIKQPAVHRLDMYTSGLLVLALTQDSHKEMSKLFENRLVKKKYIAMLDGFIQDDSGDIHLPFRLDPDNRPYQIYDPTNGKLGITKWRKIGVERKKTRVEFIPLTGRTHQLRVHAAHNLGLGCPIIGDTLYGDGKEGDQMMLHASFLSFTHPISGKSMKFESGVPF
jgi:tRNA pseudouridine32 synthase / 23S rRNA pseudouridine746 synthase